MTITVQATYQNGMLKPARLLPLRDGETVEILIASADEGVAASFAAARSLAGTSCLPAPTAGEADYVRRIKGTQSLEELLAVMDSAPSLPDNYDLQQALNANRKATGERLLFPEAGQGSTS